MQYPSPARRGRNSNNNRYHHGADSYEYEAVSDDDDEDWREDNDSGEMNVQHEVCLLPPPADPNRDWVDANAATRRTWAAVVFVCATGWIATEVVRALEAIRVRYLNTVPTRPLREERGALDRAEVLQHHAKQYIAARGLPIASGAPSFQQNQRQHSCPSPQQEEEEG